MQQQQWLHNVHARASIADAGAAPVTHSTGTRSTGRGTFGEGVGETVDVILSSLLGLTLSALAVTSWWYAMQ
jgi:hypothetical protein